MLTHNVSATAASSIRFALPDGAGAADDTACEVRFCSLFREGCGLSFPCDRNGRVDLDALPPRAMHNYLYARAMVGRDFAPPVVMPRAMQ
jgi:hypothetical protein